MPVRALLLAFTASVIAPLLAAQDACPAGEEAMCYGGSCICIPPLSGDLEAMRREALRIAQEARGPALAVWLMASRDELRELAAPVPPAIRAALAGYVDSGLLDRARFTVGGRDSANLADMALRYGDLLDGRTVTAITLVDVIVFRNEDDALGNAALWAHELTHVGQFAEWGVEEFAERYAADPVAVEAPAYATGDAYAEWRGRNPSPDE